MAVFSSEQSLVISRQKQTLEEIKQMAEVRLQSMEAKMESISESSEQDHSRLVFMCERLFSKVHNW